MIPRKLMLCVEGPRSFHAAKAQVAWLARKANAAVLLFHAAGEEGAEPEMDFERLSYDPVLRGLAFDRHVAERSRAIDEDILAVAEDRHADVIVVPSHARKGLNRLVFGSMAERVLRRCRLPVLTLDMTTVPKTEAEAAVDRVVIMTDFSIASGRAARAAAALASRFACPATLVHMVEDYYASAYPAVPAFPIDEILEPVRTQLAEEASRLSASAGVEVDTRLDIGKVTDGVAAVTGELANPLVVVASAGRDSIGDEFLGSRAERIARTAACSVLTLPASYLAAGAGEEEAGAG